MRERERERNIKGERGRAKEEEGSIAWDGKRRKKPPRNSQARNQTPGRVERAFPKTTTTRLSKMIIFTYMCVSILYSYA